MATYFCKLGGDSSSPTTDPATGGDWSSAYPDIDTALGNLTDGDVLKVSDGHSKTYAGTVTFNHSGAFDGAGVAIISVADLNTANYSPGAAEGSGPGGDIDWQDNVQSYGIDYTIEDDCQVQVGCRVFFSDCKLITTGSLDKPLVTGADGVLLRLQNVDIKFGATNGSIAIDRGSRLEMIGGSVDSTGSAPTIFISSWGGSGGASLHFVGVDLSHVSGTLFGTFLDSATGDNVIVTLRNCELNSAVTVATTISGHHKRIELYGCDDTTGNLQYAFHIQDNFGQANEETTIYRDDGSALSYDDSTKISIKVVTTSKATKHTPFVFEMPVSFADLATASTDNVRVFLACSNTLDSEDIYFQLIYPDGTNAAQPNFVSNAPGSNGTFLDPLASGNAYTDDSGSSDWRNGAGALVGYNEYRTDLDTSGDVGSKGVPILRVYCCKASETFYIDSEFELVSG